MYVYEWSCDRDDVHVKAEMLDSTEVGVLGSQEPPNSDVENSTHVLHKDKTHS